MLLRRSQKIIRAEPLDEPVRPHDGAHLAVAIDQDRRRRQRVPAVVRFLRRRRQHLCRLRQVFVLIRHDCEMRELRLRFATAVRVVERDGNNADLASIEVLVTRYGDQIENRPSN